MEAPEKDASEAVRRGRPAIASFTAESDGDGGIGAVAELWGRRVLSYATALGGAAEVSSFLCITVWTVSGSPSGVNIKLLSGWPAQVSGIAALVSVLVTFTSALPLSCFSVGRDSASSRSRLRCAIWRAAGILLPAHIQAYLSAFLWFCLSTSL